MSSLISGKEAKLTWANGGGIQLKRRGIHNDWQEDIKNYSCGVFDNSDYVFRLKPKTITLNGIEVAQLVSSKWCIDNPNKVVLEFNSQDDASFFSGKALNIFNNCK